jgi:hypothetical protein
MEDRSWGCDLYTGHDERIVRRVAITTRCRMLGRKSGCIPGGTAIGNKQHFIVIALSRAVGRVAVRANNPHRGGLSRWARRSRRAGLASWTRRTCRSWITFRAFRILPASCKDGGQGDYNQCSIQLNTFKTRPGRTGSGSIAYKNHARQICVVFSLRGVKPLLGSHSKSITAPGRDRRPTIAAGPPQARWRADATRRTALQEPMRIANEAMTTLRSLARYHNYEIASAAFQIRIVLCSAAVITGTLLLVWVAGGVAIFSIVFTALGLFAPHALHLG